MKKWYINKEISLVLIITLIGYVIQGIAFAAIHNAQVDKLDKVIFGDSMENSLAYKLGILDEKVDKSNRDIHDIKQTVERIEGFMHP